MTIHEREPASARPLLHQGIIPSYLLAKLAESERYTQAAEAAKSPFGHPFYRYSIIPGGAHSKSDLEAAVQRDGIAASHYAGFAIDKAKPVALQRDEPFYVSYRMGDQVYWTARPILLQKGEAVMSDGTNLIRARCGNRLSAKPQQPVKSKESEPSYLSFNVPTPVRMGEQEDSEPGLDTPPDLPRQVSMTETLARNAIAMTPLQSLINTAVPEYNNAADAPVLSAYVPTPNEHEKPPIFASDGGMMGSTLPGYYSLSSTPTPEAVPEPGTAALEGIALLGIAALSYYEVRRRRTA